MQTNQNLFEINHQTLKLILGLIALCLPFLAYTLSLPQNINSVSESYHQDGWARNIFVGFLFAIAAFLMAYKGYRQSKFILSEMVLSKIARVVAVLVAFGIAWLTASRNLPIITSKAERLSVFSSQPASQP